MKNRDFLEGKMAALAGFLKFSIEVMVNIFFHGGDLMKIRDFLEGKMVPHG